jgi:hypothetical protein
MASAVAASSAPTAASLQGNKIAIRLLRNEKGVKNPHCTKGRHLLNTVEDVTTETIQSVKLKHENMYGPDHERRYRSRLRQSETEPPTSQTQLMGRHQRDNQELALVVLNTIHHRILMTSPTISFLVECFMPLIVLERRLRTLRHSLLDFLDQLHNYSPKWLSTRP